MFLRPVIEDDPYCKIAEKIKKDLISIFQKKGISFSEIHIDMNSGNVNVQVCINDK